MWNINISDIIPFLMEYWFSLLIGIIVVCFISITIYKFVKLPIDQKYKTIRAYLLYIVTVAEENWGGGTGPIKLGEVYDAFTKKYPIIKLFISWETFNKLVDSALDEMREILEAKELEAATKLGG